VHGHHPGGLARGGLRRGLRQEGCDETGNQQAHALRSSSRCPSHAPWQLRQAYFIRMPALVRLDRVTKDYSEGRELRHVLKDASLSVDEGEFVAIRGRSGSGKSTVLNLVAGIDRPTSGEVYFGETALGRLSARERTLLRRDQMGFVFQFFNLIPTLSVLENVLLPAELAGLRQRARALELLERVGLDDRPETFPDQLSGGEQQRVAIARALVRDPRLVLADEPTGNLDDATGASVMELLDSVTRGSGKTLLLVTHSRELAALADRELTIEAGRVV
jgi:putative ABC transport system ATP-binding protein